MSANSSNITLNISDCGSDVHYYYVDGSTKLGVVVGTEEEAIAGNSKKYGSFTGGYLTGGKGTSHAGTKVGAAMYITGGAKVTLENVNFVGNDAVFGGGIHISHSTLTVKGGTFVGNTGHGSAVNADGNSTVDISDAYITNNEGGLRTDLNNFTIGGKLEVFGNALYDLLRCSSSKVFKIGAALQNTHPMAVDVNWGAYAGYPFTSGLSGKGDAGNFTCTTSDYVVRLNGAGEAHLTQAPVATVTSGDTVNEYTDFSSALSAWADGSTLQLSRDVTTSSTIDVGNEETKTLDLNGHGIKKTGTGRILRVIDKATLNISDSNPQIEHKFTVNNGLATVNDDLQSDYQTFSGGYLTGGYANGGAADGWGGCLVVSLGGVKATVNMSGGTMIGNRCDMSGGAVRIGGDNKGNGDTVFNMTGGAIMYNTAGFGGGITSEDTGVTIKMSGGVIENNYVGSNKVDLYLNNGQKIVVDSAFATSASISVQSASGSGTFTSGWSTYMAGKDPADYFVSTDPNYIVDFSDGEAMLLSSNTAASVNDGNSTTYYTDFNSAHSAWVDGSTLKLLKDVKGQVTVTGGKKTLNLNNHSLTYTSGSVIIVSGGTLTICDNSGSKTVHYYTPNTSGVAAISGSETDYSFEGGYVTGGVATEARGGGLRMHGTGSVVFSSGTIFANSAGWGGGIWTAGTGSLTIEGTASIIGNYSSGSYTSGGGIFMEGSCAVTMTGGSIRHNSAQYSGGGVRDCIAENSGVRFTMTGGEITGNYSSNDQGNGFCFDMATTFNVGGTARIVGNQGTNDMYVYNGRYLSIVSPFEKGAMIGLTLQGGTGAFTSGWSTYMEGKDPADYFLSNAGYYVISKNGEATISETLHTHSWTYTAEGNVITATCEAEGCPLGDLTMTITANDKVYDGTEVVATLSYGNDWTEENGLDIPEIVYSGNTDLGTYTASITLGGATASTTFTIKPYHEHALSYKAEGNVLTAFCTEPGCDFVPQTIKIIAEDKVYDGTPVVARLDVDPNWNALYGMPELPEIAYSGNTDLGTYTASITLGGATASTTFTIKPYHDHPLSFKAEGNVLTAFCAEPGCDFVPQTITIRAEDKVYDGTPVVARLDVDPNWNALYGMPALPEIVYSGNTDLGTYTASITLGGATASTTFTIKPYHEHALSYKAEGNVLTAFCPDAECGFVPQTIKIKAEDKVYDGTPVVATLDVDPNWNALYGMPEVPEVVYSGNTNVGTYTASITLGGATASVEFKILPATETDVEVVGGDMTINGVDEEMNAIIEDNPTANNVSLAVKLEEKTEGTAASGDEIAEYVDNKALSYFDVTLELTLDSVTTPLTETQTVLEIGIPYEKVNKRGLAVYSYHDGQMRTFAESDTRAEGTFRVDKANSMVYIYTNTFSTFAIGYTPYYRVNLDLSFGAFDGKIDVILEDKDGNIVYKLENVDARNVVFGDVAMGRYKAIVSWSDGKITTSLAFTLDIGPGGVVITPIPSN